MEKLKTILAIAIMIIVVVLMGVIENKDQSNRLQEQEKTPCIVAKQNAGMTCAWNK